MAKAIGYDNVYCCNGGWHGLTEIDGLIYDVVWSLRLSSYALSYYGVSYNYNGNGPDYKRGISKGYAYIRIKI